MASPTGPMIETDSPYSEALASSTASSTEATRCTGATGPKISCDQAGMSGVTSVRTVGR